MASAWVQVPLCLVGAQQLTVASVKQKIQFNTDPPLFCLKRRKGTLEALGKYLRWVG